MTTLTKTLKCQITSTINVLKQYQFKVIGKHGTRRKNIQVFKYRALKIRLRSSILLEEDMRRQKQLKFKSIC